jgi:TRAP-type mannitol/chloroaromatic compound transport system permease small subunit
MSTSQPPGWLLQVIRVCDTLGEWSGRIVAWLILPLVFGLTYEVVMRYGFDAPTIWAYDLSYMLYGAHFMLGAGYTLLRKGHIRTDFFYEHWPARRQGLVDACAYLFLFFPGMLFFFLASYDAAAHAWAIRETSEASAWRPIIYPFKTVMPVTAGLVLVQGFSEFLKAVWAARTGRWL